MAYATKEDYSKYVSAEVPDNIEPLLEKSSDVIDSVTFNRIRGKGFENLTDYQKEMVTKAVCYQLEFMANYSDYINVPLTGFTAGSVSMQFSKDNQFNGKVMDLKAIDCIKNSGLAQRRL